jgi:hypothetical protein
MGLPSGYFEEFFQGGAARLFQQVEDLSRLVEDGLALLFVLGRFLSLAGVLPRPGLLRRNVR